MGWWPHARAVLIALALVLGLVDGCPSPRNGTERRIAAERMGPTAAAVAARLERWRGRLLDPVRPASELFGLRQRWKLFAGANRKRYRMTIEVRAAGEPWRLVYRPHDDQHDFLAAQIGYRRLRGAWNPSTTYGPRGGYRPFVNWIADELFARDPRLTDVRVQMERIVIGDHGGYRVTGETVHPIVVMRRDRERAVQRARGRR